MRSKRTTIKNKNELPATLVKKKPLYKKLQRNHKVSNAQKVVYDGIQFQSGLEKIMYNLLKEAGLVFEKDFFYEKDSVTLIEPFSFENKIFLNRKRDKLFVLDSNKARPMKYTPDFSEKDTIANSNWVIECKGNPNEQWPIKIKLFKKWLSNQEKLITIYIPSNKQQCEQTIKMIMDDYSN
jgi:hypothetical protein